jgi:hypothetical protein
MSALKGFGESGDNKESNPSSVIPRPGTMAHLRYIEDQKKKGKLKESARSLEELTTSKSEAPSKTKAPSLTEGALVFEPPSQIEGLQEDIGLVSIERNYMRFDLDIFGVLAEMSGAEAKIYLDFIRRSYGQESPQNTCSCTNPMIAKDTGISSPATLAKTLDGLEKKGFIKRLFTARKTHEQSVYRIFLPCELSDRKSLTVISFHKE